jgi:hypothetical protein
VLAALVFAGGLIAGIAGAADPASTPPTLKPIVAEFSEQARATSYLEDATDVASPKKLKLSYAWTQTPPADDPTCNEFAVTPGQPNRAVWAHSDDNGCHHNGIQHEGDVTVVVSDGSFSCTATYHGTLSGTGPVPAPCTDLRPPTSSAHTTTGPTLIPRLVNPVEDPTLLYKRVMGELSKENIQIAKDGGLFSFLPSWHKYILKGTAGLKEKDTFVEVILDKVGLSKRGLGTAAFKKGFALISIVGDVSAITFDLAALYQGWQAADPPRSDFGVLAVAKGPHMSLPASVTANAPPAAVQAANALLANAAQLKSANAALLTTFERVQGAFKAGNAAAEAKQAKRGAQLADQAAALMLAQAPLRARLVAATRSFGAPFTMPPDLVAGVSAGRTVLVPEIASAFRQAGLTPKQIALAKKQLLAPAKGSFVFPDFLATPQAAAADRKGAEALRGFAAFLRSIATG